MISGGEVEAQQKQQTPEVPTTQTATSSDAFGALGPSPSVALQPQGFRLPNKEKDDSKKKKKKKERKERKDDPLDLDSFGFQIF